MSVDQIRKDKDFLNSVFGREQGDNIYRKIFIDTAFRSRCYPKRKGNMFLKEMNYKWHYEQMKQRVIDSYITALNEVKFKEG